MLYMPFDSISKGAVLAMLGWTGEFVVAMLVKTAIDESAQNAGIAVARTVMPIHRNRKTLLFISLYNM